MNTQKTSSTHWLKKVFALLALLNSFTAYVIASETSPSITVTSQYRAETSYYNTWNNSILYDPRIHDWFLLGLGGEFGISKNDLEHIHYKIEPTFLYQKWFEGHIRVARKIFLPDTTSFTHFLWYVKLQTPPLGAFSFFTKLGMYFRLWELNRATVFPVPTGTTFTENDFALGLGIEYKPQSVFFARFQAATFDALDVFNLNHPYGEVSGGIWLTDFWTLTAFYRYQVSLGFGRLDKMVFGVSMDFITDRYWD